MNRVRFVSLAVLLATAACQATEASAPATAPVSALPQTSVSASASESASESGDIVVGEPVVFSEGGAVAVGVVVENAGDEDATVTLEAVAADGTAVADSRNVTLAAGERRAVAFAADSPPSTAGLAVEVTATEAAQDSPESDAASQITFGEPRAETSDVGLRQLLVDVTNDGNQAVDLVLGAAVLSGSDIVGLGGATLDGLPAGGTETVEFLMFGDTTNLDDVVVYVDELALP